MFLDPLLEKSHETLNLPSRASVPSPCTYVLVKAMKDKRLHRALNGCTEVHRAVFSASSL